MRIRPAETVERFLWRKGFPPGPVRGTAKILLLLAGFLFAFGLVLLPLATWPFWLGAGAALSAWNFYSMARFVLALFPSVTAQAGEAAGKPDGTSGGSAARSLLLGQLLRSNLRLFITGFLVYTALVVCHANPFALTTGLSAAVAVVPALFFPRHKERGKKTA